MGCDIHIFTEESKTINNVTKWRNVDNWNINHWYGVDEHEIKPYNVNNVYHGRDYELFTFLAGVRNYGHEMSYFNPKGFPADASKEVRKEYEYWGTDAHTPSYLTIHELKESNSCQKITRSGLISPKQAEQLNEGKPPDSWCQGTSDKSWVYREWIEEQDILKHFMKELEPHYKDVMWIFNDDRNIEKEKQFRIVFWFDN